MLFRRTIASGLFLTAALLPAAARADDTAVYSFGTVNASVSPQQAQVNAQLADARPDLLVTYGGALPVVDKNVGGLAQLGLGGHLGLPYGGKWRTNTRYPDYYNAGLFNRFFSPTLDSPSYGDYLRLIAPGYSITTWTDRVAGLANAGFGSALDQWTGAVYYLPRQRSFGPHSGVIDLSPMPKIKPHPDLQDSRSFHP